MNGDLVSCMSCGVVFDVDCVAELVHCPVCEHTTRKTTPIPGVGRVNKWWAEVDA